MALIESFGGLLLVLGSILILRAAWRADVGQRRAVAHPRREREMEIVDQRRAA